MFSSKPASPTIRLTTWTIIILFAVIVSGSYFARVEIVARGQGKVIPGNRVQVVQPQVDGKIASIRVREGDLVKSGQPLVDMDSVAARNSIERVDAEIERQTVDAAIARSLTEALSSGDPSDSNFIERGQTAFRRLSSSPTSKVPGSEALITSTLTALRDQIAHIDAQLFRVDRARQAQQARLEKGRADQAVAQKRFASADTLRQKGAISEFEYLGRLREINSIDADVAIAERELDGLAAEATATTKQRASSVSSAQATYRKQLNDAEIALLALRSDRTVALTQLRNLSLSAPIEGRVEHLTIFTVGGFIEAGDRLLTIVPSNDTIEIESYFDNRDIGFLVPGQSAFVKFDAFPAERYGVIKGRVTQVGADSRGDVVPGQWVYAARIALDQNSIRVADSQIPFVTGMTATIDVVTGERRLISYFFEPVFKALQDSFGER